MSPIFEFVSGVDGELAASVARLTAAALVAGVWQGLLLCAATGVILKAVPQTTPRLRFVVWSAVFCVSVALPFASMLGGSGISQPAVAAAAHWVFDPRWSYALAAVWVLAAACRAAGLLLQAWDLRAIWRSAVPVRKEALEGLDGVLVVSGRMVELCTSHEVDRPSVIGFFAPRILVPDWLFAQLSVTELNHIVLHEIEHLRRRDDWLNLLQKIGLVLLPLNPALFWIDRRLSTERELACDDGVLERTKTPRAYAASLTSVAERRLEVRRHSKMGALALAATGMLRRRSELGERIESILGRRAPVNPVFAGGIAVVLVAGIAGSAAWLARAPQLVSFGGAALEARSRGVPAVARDAGPRSFPSVAGTEMLPAAGFQNVSFRQPVKRAAVKAKASVRRPAAVAAASRSSGKMAIAPAALPRQFVVLTSWQESPVSSPISRIVIAMPDGRFFVAPYAAVPTQAGWLIVQL